jgi:hypothetical protein
MAGYYDYVLGFIPLSLLGITAALTLAGVSITVAAPVAAVGSIAAIGHGLFVNAPVDSTEQTLDAPATTNGPVPAAD